MKKEVRLAAAGNRPSASIGPAEPYRAPRYRVTLVCETEGTGTAEPIRDSLTAVELFRPCFEGLDREHFLVCGLDAKHRAIGINLVSVGTLTLSIVHPREVFKPLIVMNAAAWLASHNHPSGDSAPSQEDRLLTKRLREVGELLGITLLDHVILGEARHYSFADDGWP
ncbi:MAG: JAB domain-containing protein [Nitrospira sp.]|nr:JAB domain-containing protein [Nitrospira sp.]MDH4245679.1 JAB domain-containing protein [Nitrospira sp.]MDH4354479.1 JAB domain-containing protein [Nitrospira sp.]MDH5320376.1 JAB domain-containing protein [Nitrospira sp.]